MFYILSKLTAFISNPLFWLVGLFVIAYFTKNKKRSKLFFASAILLFIFLGNGLLISKAELMWVDKYIHPNLSNKKYEYALIQGGFGTFNPLTKRSQLNPSGERLVESIRLYKTGRVKKLFITGDGTFSDKKHPESVKIFLEYLHAFGVAADDIILESNAKNTRQSASYSKKMLGSVACSNSLLVTCATHMPRSLKCYQKEGLYPQPYPTFIPKPFEFNIATIGLSAKNLDRWQILFHEWIGMIAYKFVGYI